MIDHPSETPEDFREDTIKFIVQESLDGVAWRTIYQTRMNNWDISVEEVEEAIKKKLSKTPGQLKYLYANAEPETLAQAIELIPVAQVKMLPRTWWSGITVAATGLFVFPLLLWVGFLAVQTSPLLLNLLQAFMACLVTIFAFLVSLKTLSYYFIVSLLPFTVRIIHRRFAKPPTHVIIGDAGLLAVNATTDEMKGAFGRKLLEIAQKPNLAAKTHQMTAVDAVEWRFLDKVYLDTKREAKIKGVVCFESVDAHNARLIVKITLGDVLTTELRQNLLTALKERSPNAFVDPAVYALLESAPDVGYTELWISALSAVPARKNLIALASDVTLNDGKYKISAEIGGGGQGTVYLAHTLQPGTDTPGEEIVIKEYILPIHVTRATRKQAIESLENEVNLLKKLDDPHIVKLIDFFVDDHRGYLVFEYVRGENLRTFVEKNGPIGGEKVRELALEMCTILSYLHSQNPPLIHRDFTPDNLMLAPDGHLKLIDFNVAQPVSNMMSANVVGKRSYMAPEQLRGKPVIQTDIYAFGATLYFLLTGVEPEPLSVLHPKESNVSVSSSLDAIVAKCTQLTTAARYSSTSLIADAINDAIHSNT
jgi:hypothetical protein